MDRNWFTELGLDNLGMQKQGIATPAALKRMFTRMFRDQLVNFSKLQGKTPFGKLLKERSIAGLTGKAPLPNLMAPGGRTSIPKLIGIGAGQPLASRSLMDILPTISPSHAKEMRQLKMSLGS